MEGGFDWNLARTFLAAAQAGSFSGAARALGVAQPTVGRQVAALEQALGVTLFERVGRGLVLTAAGQDLVDQVQVMGEAAARLARVAAGRSTDLEGPVAITASEAVSAFLLGPAVARIRSQHPGLLLELVATNQIRDLRRREADLALRNTRPTDPELVGRLLRTSSARLYATPACIERLGLRGAADLARADIFAFDDGPALGEGLRALGLPVTAASFPIVCGSHLVQWALCRQGLGICVMLDEVGAAHPDVVPVLPDLPPIPVPLWLVCHRELHTSRRLRVVFDLLVELLATSSP